MIEPFRWLVDHAVYKLVNSVSTNQTIRVKDYARLERLWS
ncbi:MAG: hypothetical protein ACREBA_01990 [Nitrosotalea sp.]